jgi:hypothetical protein
MIAEDLVERLSAEAAQRLLPKAREGRIRALATIRECHVTLTSDGRGTWVEVFARPPTLGELVARAGPGAFVAAVAMRTRRSLRSRWRLRIAAE